MKTRNIVADGQGGMPTIVALRDELLEALSPDCGTRLDLSAVTDPHLCIIQLVLAARCHAAETGADFALATPATPALVRTLERAGCAPASPDDNAFWLHGELPQ